MPHSKELRWWRRGRNNQRAVTIPGPKGTRPGVKAAETDTTEHLTTATNKPSDR